MGNQFKAAEKFVDLGYWKKANLGRESVSGPGSSRNAASSALRLIDRTLRNYRIETILDLGCGDWNWMKNAAFAREKYCNVKYTGWEANDKIISYLIKKFSDDRIKFEKKDLINDEYPKSDLIIVRDVLFHLDEDNVKKVISKSMQCGRFLIATSFNLKRGRYDWRPYNGIDEWGFGLLNLCHSEFGIADHCIEVVEEKNAKHFEERRFVNLYDFQQDFCE